MGVGTDSSGDGIEGSVVLDKVKLSIFLLDEEDRSSC
jgi:hypothetical protein